MLIIFNISIFILTFSVHFNKVNENIRILQKILNSFYKYINLYQLNLLYIIISIINLLFNYFSYQLKNKYIQFQYLL